MENKIETIGIVDWYDGEKGYGVLRNIHDQKEFFIHQSRLTGRYKHLLTEGDIVLFVPYYDQKRNRDNATKVRYFSIASDIQCAINKWIQEDLITNTYLEKIIVNYLNSYNQEVYPSFKDAYNDLVEIIWPFLENEDISEKLFSILKKAIITAFGQFKSTKLLELTYLVLMEKLPSNNYFQLLDLCTSQFLYFIFAFKNSDYTDKAIQKAIDCSRDTRGLLDDLIRFAKEINEQGVKDSLEGDKSLITSIVFISGIVGGSILSEIYRYIFSSCDSYTLEILLENGYIHDIDNPILEQENPDRHKAMMIYAYKKGFIDDIDAEFVKKNINEFSLDDIFKLLNHEQLDIRIKESILAALFKYGIKSYPLTKINESCKRAEELLKEHYYEWFASFCSDLEDSDKYFLWKNKLSNIYPETYIREKLLGSEEEGYRNFYELYQKQLIPGFTASGELWRVLTENEKVENRPIFYKILYCIKYLLKIDSSYKEVIEQKENDYYKLILWFLSSSESFDFELLCHLFIYFLPKDQVRIIKTLFCMAEDGKIQLSIKMLDSLLRVDADLYGLISAQHPMVPIDVSSEIIIKALVNISEKGNFSTDKDVLTIILQASQYNKNEKFKIGSYFDECAGRKTYKWDGNRQVNGYINQIDDSWFSVSIYPYVESRVYSRAMGHHTKSVWNSSFHEAVNAVKAITGRRWNAGESYWEIPAEGKERLFEIAYEYGFEIEGSKNPHMKKFREENEGRPSRVNYCEGRPAQKPDIYVGKEFLWCRNSKCFYGCVKKHSKDDWQNYTLLDFCRILGIETDSVDSEGRIVKYGKYLTFSSIINRANTIIEHLYCRECGEMLEPVNVSNYYTHLVTHFHCTNKSCGKYHEKIYISKCFNWKCNGVIDDRDTKKCPNEWNICPECGSCCSNRIAQQRIDNCREVGIPTNPYFIDFVKNMRGHLEKREFYCWKCGTLTIPIGDDKFECPVCGVQYERKKYDFEPRRSTVS